MGIYDPVCIQPPRFEGFEYSSQIPKMSELKKKKKLDKLSRLSAFQNFLLDP